MQEQMLALFLFAVFGRWFGICELAEALLML